MPRSIRNTAYVAAIGFGLLAASALPAAAQTATSPSGTKATGTNPTGTTKTMPNTANMSAAKAPTGSLEEYHDMLRTSELNGASVYNDKGHAIGTINDMLVNDSGDVKNVVISVGGFLGIGTHYVSVPFDHLKVQPSKTFRTGMMAPKADLARPSVARPSVAGPGVTPAANNAATPAPNAPGMAAGTQAPGMPVNGTATGTAPALQYYSVVLPGATKDSLKKMPEFHYRG